MIETIPQPSKRGISVSLWHFGTSRHQPDWFPKPDILRARLSGTAPRGQGARCGAPTSHSKRSTSLVRSLSTVCCCTRGGVSFKTVSLPLLSILMSSFYSLLWRAVHLIFGLFSKGNDSYVAVDLVCPWEQVCSQSSHAAILDPLLLRQCHLKKNIQYSLNCL